MADTAFLGAAPELHVTGSGQPIVFLHPLGADRQYWDSTTSLLTDHTLITYDLPGHGDRPSPGGSYRLRDLAEELADALRIRGFDRVHLVGSSLGGLVAQEFAAAFGARLESLTLVDTVARYPQAARVQWTQRAVTARARGMDSLVAPTMATWFTADALGRDTPAVRQAAAVLRATSAGGYALACEALARADTRPLVALIDVPTLVVCGDDDLPAFVAAAQFFHDRIPRAALLWLSGKHAAVLERPAQFAHAVREFVESALVLGRCR